MDADILRRLDAIERLLRKPIEIPDFVGASYSTDAGQVIPTGTVTCVDFEDKLYDTHNCVTVGASWQFIAPITGYYHVHAAILFAQTTAWAATEPAGLSVFKNGSGYRFLSREIDHTSANNYVRVHGGVDVYLAVSDSLYVNCEQHTGGNLALHTNGVYNWITIHKIN